MSVAELERTAIHQPGKSRYHIVDADQHIDPPYSMWNDYLPARFRDMGPKIIEGDNEHDWVEFEGKRRPLFILNNLAGRDTANFRNKGKLSELRQTSTPEARLADMDLDGIDAAVLFGGGPLPTLNTELYIESFRAYNRYLADFCSAAPKRLAGVAYLPLRDVQESIGLLRDAVKLGHRAVNIPAFPQANDAVSTSAGVKNLNDAQVAALTGDPSSTRAFWHPEFEPFWAEVCEHDVTITFHLGGRTTRFGEPDHFLADLVMSKVAMAEPIAMAIYGCLFDRFPRMRWSIIESGVGWMPWMANYMDRTWERQRFWVDSKLKHLPSHYMDQNIYASFIRDRPGILSRDLPGGKNIMWSSDFPHSETTFPKSQEAIDADFAGVPEDAVREIVGGIAARLFDLA